MSPQNPNFARFNDRTSDMKYWQRYALMTLMLEDLAKQIPAEQWQRSMEAGCKFGIDKVGPQLVEKVSS